MSLWNDPKYKALAAVSAKVLGTNNREIIAAILAQWTCEKGNHDAYPPSRNNPGNLARGAAQGLGEPFHVDYPNPQPGNPIVTFQTPQSGARAYAKLLNSGQRYAGVRAAVHNGNGRAFIIAMGKSGYGTGTACMLSAYHPPAPTPPPEEASDMAILLNDPGYVVEIPAGGAWFLDSERRHKGANFGPTEATYVGWVPSGPSRAVIVATGIANGGVVHDTVVYVSPDYVLKAPPPEDDPQ